MVQVRKQLPDPASGAAVDLDEWVEHLAISLDDQDGGQLLEACRLLQQLAAGEGEDPGDWATESDCFAAGLDTALILAELHVGASCLVAGVLYRAVREKRITLEEVGARFGEEVEELLQGVLRMAAIGELRLHQEHPVLGQAHAQKDNIRKMLIALVDDVRVALIKLAERTCAIRAVKNDEERRELVAREVFDVYAPLAHRLGIGHLKWELEDLSFRYIYTDAYRKIARLLDGKRLERDQFIVEVKELLSRVLGGAGLEFEIEGRAKHIYSIWRKMQRKGIGFSQVYDIRAVRILVPEVKDCYATLGLVHGLWRNIPNEFDDYIANPKENGYRSLHTAVIGPEGKILEVQIRTHQMHEEAELGVCAHWRYKGSDGGDGMASTYEEKIAWLRQVLDWHEETGDADEVAEQFSFNVAQDRVYVFTPDGDVVNLAHGATPLDFAYHVHTEVGHRCRGAKVNGSIVPLTYELKTGERVEILTSNEGQPKRDWLQPGLGYLRTSRARAKVQHWFRSQAREENIAAGRQLLEREFRRLALTSVDYQRITRKVSAKSVEDMFALVGSGELASSQVLNAAQGLVERRPEPELKLARPGATRYRSEVQVHGVGNLLNHMAGCCKPLPGDAITGFITQGRGVSIHRTDCARLVKLQEASPERVIEVEWGGAPTDNYEVDVAIEAYDRHGLLRDITGLFANAHINVLSINTQTNKKSHTATMRLRVEVPNLASLSKLLERINRLHNVISANRCTAE
ncbi:GTP diphosphokinase [Halioglobus japonicus]|uniref:GTP pyrophosphokinase n=2 Tax=Halioglobus TaxID=1217416 RepID=A0AAP8MET0_9GAMM|nr:GTP diphosphokinase [Halioglobus japonicus]AQA18479.1 GTP diphosphokinase [Halioglobus japonicus]PLW86496.1 GTP diphosphokinase [Halioglobus japonicus]GHD12539.1 GTP pyrophosphokinase [Halioglobus japonicus]